MAAWFENSWEPTRRLNAAALANQQQKNYLIKHIIDILLCIYYVICMASSNRFKDATPPAAACFLPLCESKL